jgi:hypothetical protein
MRYFSCLYIFATLNTWKKHFPQAEIHGGEPLVPEPIVFDVEVAVEKLQRHKSAGTSHLPLELCKHVLQNCGLRSTNLFILFVIKKNVIYCTSL